MKKRQIDDFLSVSQDVFYSRNLVENRYEYISDSIYGILGYTSKEFKSLNVEVVLSLIHSEDKEKVQRFFQNLSKSKNSNKRFHIEYRIKHKNGQYVWVNENISMILEGNKPTHMVGNLRDVSVQKQVEFQLNQQNALLESIISNTPGSVWSVDKNYKFIHGNQNFKKNIKQAFKKEFKIGANILELLSDNEYKEWKDYYDRAINGETFNFERLSKYKKTESWNEYYFTPIKSEINEIIGVTVTAYDITLRKLAENTIIESEQRFREFTNGSPVGIYTIDLNGECTFANKSWLEIAGMSLEEALGDGWINGIHPEDRINIAKKLYQAIHSEDNRGFEYRFKDKHGKITWVYGMSVALHNKDGEINGYLGTNININKIKTAEKKIKKSNKQLKELNATKDKLLSVIAHDLKSPFNSILGFSQLLVKHIKNKQFDKVERFSNIIYLESQHSLELLSNLLEWSRSQTSNIIYEPTKFELTELIEEVVDLASFAAIQKQISISFQKVTGLEIFADRNLLSTVLRNLINNAIKFTKNGGKVEIYTKQLKTYLLVAIQDNGIGMNEEKLKGLFKTEVVNSTKGTNEEKGTGLGLILCKEFIKYHKGEIWAESKLDKGTTFYFTIPKNNPR